MIAEGAKAKIISIWDNYLNNKRTFDTKGNEIIEIDKSRVKSIEEIKAIISKFLTNQIDIYEFKTTHDSYNKRNNYWGFTATKGQMFFNQLANYNEQGDAHLTKLLQATISEPKDLTEALAKIEMLETFASSISDKAKDKRKAPNPGSVGYFLSYFWQIFNHEKWPIIYTSLTNAFTEISIWKEHKTQSEDYDFFYALNEEVKGILKTHAKRDITNWDAEHAFWSFSGNPAVEHRPAKKAATVQFAVPNGVEEGIKLTANFNVKEYLIPKVANLIELGKETGKSASSKGYEYEKAVADVFKLLGFETEVLGQGTGRNPDIIIKYREEHTAFIVDAKAYNEGYVMGRDDRAIKEYISKFCPQLKKEMFIKIGFILVSNSFKTDLKDFANEITWNTEIKRFIQLTSEALLYYLAYSTKDDRINVSSIIESIINLNGVITAQNVIEKFGDW